MISRRFLLSLVSAASLALGTPAFAQGDPLPSWNDGAAKRSIVAFVEKVTQPGWPDFVPRADRIATFDNDGTLWSEQPMPVQLYFARTMARARATAFTPQKAAIRISPMAFVMLKLPA